MSSDSPQHTIILGSGIMGLCSAYYLLHLSPASSSHHVVTLIENSPSLTIAGGASSFAGGFLAGGPAWHEGPARDLSRLSWECHVEMARELKGEERYGWRESRAAGLNVGGKGESRSKYRTLPGGVEKKEEVGEEERERGEAWYEGEKEELSTEGGVGQVDPAEFCKTVYEHLKTTFPTRFKTVFGNAVALSHPTSSSSPSSPPTRTLTVLPLSAPSNPLHLPHTSLLLSAGPWTPILLSALLLPTLPILNLPGHSLLCRPSPSLTPASGLPSEAVFAGIAGAVVGVHASTSGLARGLTEEEKSEGYTRSPELFTRRNGWVYVAGENSIPSTGREAEVVQTGEGRSVEMRNRLPRNVDLVKGMIDPGLVARLKRGAGAVSPLLKEENGAVVEREQFCYRPTTPDMEPFVGELVPGVFVATGHGPWGITQAPGTGKIIAELVLGLPLSADVSGLSTKRFDEQEKVRAKL